MTEQDLMNDIPERLAYDAHAGISWSPEQRAVTQRQSYAAKLLSIRAWIEEQTDNPAEVEAEFSRFREGYKRRYLAYLASRSRIVSPMISGPANFPVARMEKRNRVAHARLEELIAFEERARAAIHKNLHPELRPIMAGDSDAVERLREKIAEAEKAQDIMKRANAAIRKHRKAGPEAQIAALVEVGLSQLQATKLLEPDCFGNPGFAGFELSNNNANIRRMRERLEQIQRNHQKEATEQDGEHAKLEDCPADNRVRIYFDGKPAADVRQSLKSNGFRWAPSLGAWQAYRNWRTIEFARQVAGVAQEVAQ